MPKGKLVNGQNKQSYAELFLFTLTFLISHNVCFVLSIIFSSKFFGATASLVTSEKMLLLHIAQNSAVSIHLHQRLQ